MKGLGDEEKPVSSVMGKISEETLEDIKGIMHYTIRGTRGPSL